MASLQNKSITNNKKSIGGVMIGKKKKLYNNLNTYHLNDTFSMFVDIN